METKNTTPQRGNRLAAVCFVAGPHNTRPKRKGVNIGSMALHLLSGLLIYSRGATKSADPPRRISTRFRLRHETREKPDANAWRLIVFSAMYSALSENAKTHLINKPLRYGLVFSQPTFIRLRFGLVGNSLRVTLEEFLDSVACMPEFCLKSRWK